MGDVTIALAGNPNAGKSTIFNTLTGLNQHTGNWPGKTVEKRTGYRTYKGINIEFIDLPGTYSLAAFSPDEMVARTYIMDEQPDAVICTVDATNLERNLYLVVEILELGTPVIVALNMSDEAHRKGMIIDHHLLSERLNGTPVVPTIATRGKGIDLLLAQIEQSIQKPEFGRVGKENVPCACSNNNRFQIPYGTELEGAIRKVVQLSMVIDLPLNGYCQRWLALKLLEGEDDVIERVIKAPGGRHIVERARAESANLESSHGDEVDFLTADQRYRFISEVSKQVVETSAMRGVSITQYIDRLAANRVLGLPIFLAVMYFVFRLVIDVSEPFLDWVDAVVNGPVAGVLSAILQLIGAAPWLHSLAIDGIVAGVGGILTFVPGLVALFFFLAVLEDSGYMARASFVMDRFMRIIGLHGKSVIPLMLGFGCAVPAIYSTRTIASRRDRLLTALLIPLMSCSARLPVYVVFTLAFFGNRAGTIIWSLYVFGIFVAILVGFLFSRTILKPDPDTTFVLELPPYRRPSARSLAIHTWENTRDFIRKAGTVILAISIILWFLLNLPWGVTDQRDSYFGQLSSTIAPALEPVGFGSWQTSGALVTGVIAKELVVSSLAQLYVDNGLMDTTAREEPVPDGIGNANLVNLNTIKDEATEIAVGFYQAVIDAGRTIISMAPGVNLMGESSVVEDTALSRALQSHFTPITALAFVVFVLLYVPCMATIGAIKQEFGVRWAMLSGFYQTSVAWLAAALVYQLGSLIM